MNWGKRKNGRYYPKKRGISAYPYMKDKKELDAEESKKREKEFKKFMKDYKTNGVNYATPESDKNTKRMLRKQFEKREEERKRLASDLDDSGLDDSGFFDPDDHEYEDY